MNQYHVPILKVLIRELKISSVHLFLLLFLSLTNAWTHPQSSHAAMSLYFCEKSKDLIWVIGTHINKGPLSTEIKLKVRALFS